MEEVFKSLREKPLQAILLIAFGLVMWALALKTAQTEGMVNQVGAMFFIGLGSLIFGSYRASQVIRMSAEAGGIGRHVTKRNFGFVLILVALSCWFVAWRAFNALRQFPPRPPGTYAVGLEAAAQNQMFLGALVGFLFLLFAYGLINPAKSQYARDIERHGYPRKIPNRVAHEVWLRDNGRCVICGSTEDLHLDHIIPYSKGGSSTDPKNIQLLCGKHNLEKSDRI